MPFKTCLMYKGEKGRTCSPFSYHYNPVTKRTETKSCILCGGRGRINCKTWNGKGEVVLWISLLFLYYRSLGLVENCEVIIRSYILFTFYHYFSKYICYSHKDTYKDIHQCSDKNNNMISFLKYWKL
jgi:hypothetical protein